MRFSFGGSDRKRPASFAAGEDDKENCTIGSPFIRLPVLSPDEHHACLALSENVSNKKMRKSATDRRFQAPKKSRHAAFIKPGTLAQQVRDAQKQKQAKKRLALDSIDNHHRPQRVLDRLPLLPNVAGSPERVPAGIAPRWFGPACLQRKKLLAPKYSTLVPVRNDAVVPMVEDPSASALSAGPEAALIHFGDRMQVTQSDNPFDTLPEEVLIKVVCKLDHNDLDPVFHVCNALRKAVIIAQREHFNFTTPGKTVSDIANQNQPLAFLSNDIQLPTPNAPKHVLKNQKPRIPLADLKEVTAKLHFRREGEPLINDEDDNMDNVSEYTTNDNTVNMEENEADSNEDNNAGDENNGRLRFSGASHRVLFNEDRVVFNEEELCKAIAQNTL